MIDVDPKDHAETMLATTPPTTTPEVQHKLRCTCEPVTASVEPSACPCPLHGWAKPEDIVLL
jgi:hypothetical protein